MVSRAEITSKYARAYVKASKKDKGLILDQVMSVTGWSGLLSGSRTSRNTRSKSIGPPLPH